jgi:hypothetical protein
MVEWHTCGGYRVSFDIRLHASRFIICVGETLITQGLLHADGVIYDGEVKPPEPVEHEMVRLWRAMQARLRETSR